MHKNPPIPGLWRRRLGFTLLTIGATLCLLMAVSAKWWFGYGTRTWLADLGDGTLYVAATDPNGWARPLIGWCGGVNSTYTPNAPPQSWTWTWWTWGKRANVWEKGHAYTIWPLAPLTFLCGLVLSWPAYRDYRRVRNNQCGRCGYPRAGLTPQSHCPECGQPAPVSASLKP